MLRFASIFLVASVLHIQAAEAVDFQFRDQELATRLKVGYAVRILDMNRDERPDIVIVDSKRVLWLESPNWNEHIMYADPDQPHDNVCFAPLDINGDGRTDFALGADWQFNNTRTGGTIGWLESPSDPRQPWKYHAIGEEPTVHRMRFVDLHGDGSPELVVAPLKGRNTSQPDFSQQGVRLLAYSVPKDPVKEKWPLQVISEALHVVHNFCAVPGRKGNDLLAVSFEGVTRISSNGDSWQLNRVGAGNQKSRPNRGASEVKFGQLGSGANYIATIEPWHGNQVVVYQQPAESARSALWKRHVLDSQLKWGHAVWCANLDQDEDEELIIGVRDNANQEWQRGVRIYDPQSDDEFSWSRQIVDPGSVAVEDLAAGDLNGDGRVDIVAVGRQTHNVKIYWNETK